MITLYRAQRSFFSTSYRSMFLICLYEGLRQYPFFQNDTGYNYPTVIGPIIYQTPLWRTDGAFTIAYKQHL